MSGKFPHPLPGDKKPQQALQDMVRVDHAGEYGAQRIYQGSIDACYDLQYNRIFKKMMKQEEEHLQYFENFMLEHRIRPTLMIGAWHYLSYFMGYFTYKKGKESAMLCTIAVEEEIIQHYNQQIQECASLGLQDSEIAIKIKQFCADETEHMYTAQHNIHELNTKGMLYDFIKNITKLAIFISKRI